MTDRRVTLQACGSSRIHVTIPPPHPRQWFRPHYKPCDAFPVDSLLSAYRLPQIEFHFLMKNVLLSSLVQNDQSTEDLHIIGSQDLSLLRGKVFFCFLFFDSLDTYSKLNRKVAILVWMNYWGCIPICTNGGRLICITSWFFFVYVSIRQCQKVHRPLRDEYTERLFIFQITKTSSSYSSLD